MKLNEIRDKVKCNGYAVKNNRQILLDWLVTVCGQSGDVGLTLMPSKVYCTHLSARRTGKAKKIMRHLTNDELVTASKRFVEILNRLTYKQAYKRNGKKLDVVMVVEGESELIDLHTHFAMRKPKEMASSEFARLVLQALDMSGGFEIQNPNYVEGVTAQEDRWRYKLELIDSGWLSYITKKLQGKSFSNLYLP